MSGAVVTEHFLDCRFDQSMVLPELFRLLGLPKQGVHSIPDKVGSGFLTAYQDVGAGRKHLEVRKGVALVLGSNHMSEKIIFGILPPFCNLFLETLVHVEERSLGTQRDLLRRLHRAEEKRKTVRPALESLSIFSTHA